MLRQFCTEKNSANFPYKNYLGNKNKNVSRRNIFSSTPESSISNDFSKIKMPKTHFDHIDVATILHRKKIVPISPTKKYLENKNKNVSRRNIFASTPESSISNDFSKIKLPNTHFDDSDVAKYSVKVKMKILR